MAQNGDLLISKQSASQDAQRGIYIPISDTATIDLRFKIDQLETPSDNKLTNVAIGLGSIDQIGADIPGRIIIQQESLVLVFRHTLNLKSFVQGLGS